MRRLIWMVAALGLLLGVAGQQVSAADIPAVTLDNTTGEVLGNPPFTLGWAFHVNSPISVTSLEIFDDSLDGLVDSYPTAIWDSSNNLLVSRPWIAARPTRC